MERFERQAVSRGLPLYVDLLDKGRACDPQARQFLKIFRLGFTTPARRIENSDLAAGEPRPPKPKATACEGSSSNLHSPLRYPRAESFRQRLLGKEQKLVLTCFNHPDVPPTNNQAERRLETRCRRKSSEPSLTRGKPGQKRPFCTGGNIFIHFWPSVPRSMAW